MVLNTGGAVRQISWTLKDEDGVKREVRVVVNRGGVKWQFKRKDQAEWDYDSNPRPGDWDELEEVLKRRTARGRAGDTLESEPIGH